MTRSLHRHLAVIGVVTFTLTVGACSQWSSDASDAARRAHDESEVTPPLPPPVTPCTTEEKASFDTMMASGGFASLAPLSPMPAPGAMPEGTRLGEIQNRRLVVGVDATTMKFGYRDPLSSELSGLDIELLREVARAIYGVDGDVDDHIQFKTLTTAERIPAVVNGDVDIVSSLITITCERARDVAFTTEYYVANQGVMVRSDAVATIRDAEDLAGRKVCATQGSTSLANLEDKVPDAIPYPVDERTDCLVAMQQGEIDAITADDTILVSFRAQDPKTAIVSGVDLSDEPYAMAVNAGDPDLVRFTNGVLEELRANGRLAALYQDLAGTEDDRTGFVPPAAPEPRYADR